MDKPGLDLIGDTALPGWRMAGAGGFRPTSEGIESYGGPGILWFTGRTFDDFVLTVDWRLSAITDNSGIFIRCPPLEDSLSPAIDLGYEIQIDDRGYDPKRRSVGSPLHLTGAVYGLAPALAVCSSLVGRWNRFQVEASGSTITVALNDTRVSRLIDASRLRSGHIGLQTHHSGSAVAFRRLCVRTTSDGGP